LVVESESGVTPGARAYDGPASDGRERPANRVMSRMRRANDVEIVRVEPTNVQAAQQPPFGGDRGSAEIRE